MTDNIYTDKEKTNVEMGSNRSFGIVFTIAFLIIAVWPLIENGNIRLWWLASSVTFLLVSIIVPKLLQPLNFVWFKFGLLLHKITSPIMLGLVYVLTVLPIGFIIRMFCKDNLQLSKNVDTESYWIKREADGLDAKSL